MAVTKTTTSSVQTFAKYNDANAGFVASSGPGIFIAWSNNTTSYYTSSDGFTWTTRTDTNLGTRKIVVTNIGGTAYAIGDNAALVSTTGTSWKSYNIWKISNSTINHAAKVGNNLIWTGYTGGGGSVFLAYGDTGFYTIPPTGDGLQSSACKFGNYWLLASRDASPAQRVVMYSTAERPNNSDWTLVAVDTSTNSGIWVTMATNNSTSALVCWSDTNGGVWRTTNGTTWTKVLSNVSTKPMVKFVNDTYWFGGDSGALQHSTDGVTWTAVTSQLTGSVTSVAYNGSVWVAVDSNGRISTSPDKTNWTSRATGLQALEEVHWF